MLLAPLLVVVGAGPVLARGLHLETPAWYEPAYVDTQLTLSLGVSHFRGQTDATRFFVGLAALRRGPLEFGGSLPYLFLRSPDAAESGPGDPRVDGRLRLPFPGTWPVRIYCDVSARLPTSSADLFPYASGAQDIEVSGTLSVPSLLGLHLGAGRIFAEPPSDSDLTRSDVPHATHAWIAFAARRGTWWVGARGDVLAFAVDDEARGVVRLTFGRHDPQAFLVVLDWSVDIGSHDNRIFDHGPTLRFATPLL